MSQSSERTLKLLSAIARSPEPLGLMELAGATEIDKSTAARLIGHLEAEGFVSRDGSSRKFTVGPALRSLAATALSNSPVLQIARPSLEALRDASDETAFLHMRIRDERVCLDRVDSNNNIRPVSTIGELQPLYAVPSGKVMLAYLPEDERARLLGLAVDAGYGRAELLSQFEAVRREGYLAVEQDKTPDVSIVSAPVFDAYGPNYSVTVAGPLGRWTVPRMTEFASSLVSVAHRLSLALGGGSRLGGGTA